MFLPKAVYLAWKGGDLSVSVCPSSSSQSCLLCQFFSLWLCKLIPGSAVPEQSLFRILPGVVSFCSPGTQRRFSFLGMTLVLCQEPGMHSVPGTGPSWLVMPAAQQGCVLTSKGSRQEALESSCFSSIPRDFLAELPQVNDFCPCNRQPEKLYVHVRAGKLARFRKR